jgi:hypothetical protein
MAVPVVVASTYAAARQWVLDHAGDIPTGARLISTSVPPDTFSSLRIGRIYMAPCAPTGKHYQPVRDALERASLTHAKPLI